jgi:hypothetical protein
VLDAARTSHLSRHELDHLTADLPTAVDSLWRHRAAEVPQGNLDHYVDLHWMQWSCGALMLTPNGRAVYDMVVEQDLSP